MSTINMTFNASGDDCNIDSENYLSSVGIYDGDSLISDLKTVNVETTQAFSLNYTLAAGATKTLTVKGITNTLGVTGSMSIITTWVSSVSSGLSSGETNIAGGSNVGTTAVVVYPSGVATPSADTTKTPYSQAILAPSNNVTVGALRVYAQREDLKLTDLKVTVYTADADGGTALADGDISSVVLYADDGVTALTDPITTSVFTDDATNTDVFTIASSDILDDVVFTRNAYRTILVKANVASTADATIVKVSIPNSSLKLSGQDSGATYTYGGGDFGLNFTSPYAGGTFSFDTKVVVLQKNSTSPSGSVPRGTQTVTGVWDVNNYDSNQDESTITSIKFTNKAGSFTGLTDDDTDDQLFKLYDGDGNLLADAAADDGQVELDVAAGTVTFAKANMITINPGEPKQLKIVVDTTNTAKFASNSQFQWSLEAVADATVDDLDGDAETGAVGYAGGIWTIPAVANTVQLP